MYAFICPHVAFHVLGKKKKKASIIPKMSFPSAVVLHPHTNITYISFLHLNKIVHLYLAEKLRNNSISNTSQQGNLPSIRGYCLLASLCSPFCAGSTKLTLSFPSPFVPRKIPAQQTPASGITKGGGKEHPLDFISSLPETYPEFH